MGRASGRGTAGAEVGMCLLGPRTGRRLVWLNVGGSEQASNMRPGCRGRQGKHGGQRLGEVLQNGEGAIAAKS